MRARVTLAAALVLLASSGGKAAAACRTCHPDVKTDYAESVHARAVDCVACHGGDGTALDMEAHSVAHGYVGTPSRRDVPELCASCHADPNRMKAYAIPTDQYAHYRTSGHGTQLARGDTRVAVCTDCHGAHRILSPREPASPTYRGNVAATCGRCHSDQALMAEYGLAADQVEKFRQSVHGVALYVDEHPAAPTCAGCHGPHGAVAPQVGSISAVCGHCHTRTREYFNEGPHLKAVADGRMSECISCHGYHDTPHPDTALFDTTCATCHATDSAAFETGQKLKTLLSRAAEALESASADMARAAPLFPRVARLRPRLRQAESHYLEALPVQHALALERVDDLTRNARSVAEEVQGSVHGVEQESQLRYIVLAVVWLFILFTGAVAYLYRRETRRQRAAEGGDDG